MTALLLLHNGSANSRRTIARVAILNVGTPLRHFVIDDEEPLLWQLIYVALKARVEMQIDWCSIIRLFNA